VLRGKPQTKTSTPDKAGRFCRVPRRGKGKYPKEAPSDPFVLFPLQNSKSPNRFPVIHRANVKLFTIPSDSDPSGSKPVDSLLITKGLVNIMDTVEYGTAKT
jgi:hypothetical protein